MHSSFGHSNEHAVEGFGVELAMMFSGCGIRLASENANEGNVWLIATPCLLRVVSWLRTCRDDIVQVHHVLHGVEPERVGKAGIEEGGALVSTSVQFMCWQHCYAEHILVVISCLTPCSHRYFVCVHLYTCHHHPCVGLKVLAVSSSVLVTRSVSVHAGHFCV